MAFLGLAPIPRTFLRTSVVIGLLGALAIPSLHGWFVLLGIAAPGSPGTAMGRWMPLLAAYVLLRFLYLPGYALLPESDVARPARSRWFVVFGSFLAASLETAIPLFGFLASNGLTLKTASQGDLLILAIWMGGQFALCLLASLICLQGLSRGLAPRSPPKRSAPWHAVAISALLAPGCLAVYDALQALGGYPTVSVAESLLRMVLVSVLMAGVLMIALSGILRDTSFRLATWAACAGILAFSLARRDDYGLDASSTFALCAVAVVAISSAFAGALVLARSPCLPVPPPSEPEDLEPAGDPFAYWR